MQIAAKLIHEDLAVKTVMDFARLTLPDSVLAQDLDGDDSLELYYELTDAVLAHYAARAFHVDVFLEMADPEQPDADVFFTVQDENEGAYVTDIEAVRGAFDDPGDTLEWSWKDRMWVPLPEDV